MNEIRHGRRGPNRRHKYIKIVNGRYIYPEDVVKKVELPPDYTKREMYEGRINQKNTGKATLDVGANFIANNVIRAQNKFHNNIHDYDKAGREVAIRRLGKEKYLKREAHKKNMQRQKSRTGSSEFSKGFGTGTTIARALAPVPKTKRERQNIKMGVKENRLPKYATYGKTYSEVRKTKKLLRRGAADPIVRRAKKEHKKYYIRTKGPARYYGRQFLKGLGTFTKYNSPILYKLSGFARKQERPGR